MNSRTPTDYGVDGSSREDADLLPEPTANATFENDTGVLPSPARKALVHLLAGPAIDARYKPKVWQDVLRYEAVLRSRLQDIYLELVLDREQEVAFTRQVVSSDVEIPVLLRRANLTFLESALLLFLRQKLTQASAQGERAVVDLQEVQEHLHLYEKEGNSDHAKFEKQIAGAIEKVQKLNLLKKLASSDSRLEVSPALKLLFSSDAIEQLTHAYAEYLVNVDIERTGVAVAVEDAGSDADEDLPE